MRITSEREAGRQRKHKHENPTRIVGSEPPRKWGNFPGSQLRIVNRGDAVQPYYAAGIRSSF